MNAIEIAARLETLDLYARYAACLDAGAFDAWPNFFAEDCFYLVQPRENYAAGLPLALMRYESRGMLKDRAFGVAQTLFHAPYYQRHVFSAPLIRSADGGAIEAESNFIVARTKRNQPTELFVAGRSIDRLVRVDDGWKFERRECVLDTELIPNSLIYPI